MNDFFNMNGAGQLGDETAGDSPPNTNSGNTGIHGGSVKNPSVIVPVGNVQNTNSNSNFQQYWNSGLSVVSQAIGAWGKNPTLQLSAGGIMPTQGLIPQQQQPIYQQQQQTIDPNAPVQVGATLGGGLDGIIGWFMANPLVLIGGGVGLYLLFKQPPGRR